MKNHLVLTSLIFCCAVFQNVLANEVDVTLQKAFGDKPLEITVHDKFLLKVAVDSSAYFSTHDGRYVFSGQIYDTQRNVDILVVAGNELRKDYLSEQPEGSFVSYPSIGVERHTVTVFTAIDCPYCRKLHNYIEDLNRAGVSVNYVMVPRGDLESSSYNKTLSALCSDAPAKTITLAMQGEVIPNADCDNTMLPNQIVIARTLKISSTPTIVLPDGELKAGLITPDELAMLLASKS